MIRLGISRRRAWVAAVATALAGVVALVLPVTRSLSHWSYELPFLVRPHRAVEGVVLVHMDVSSEDRLGTGRWDRWDRGLHVRLLEVLKKAGARAVAFDLVFLRGTNQAANADLVAAMRAHGQVAVAARPGAAIHAEGARIGTTLLRPFHELAEVASWGLAEAADETETPREHVRDLELEIPSLAWRVLELTTNRWPSDPFAARWINYYGPAYHLPHVSYADALDPAFPAGLTFSNQVVFVGAAWDIGFTGGTGVDYHRTPHTLITGRRMPGVEVCATTYLNLARGDWLRRPGPMAETSLVVLVGLGLGWGWSRMRPGRAVLASLAVALGLPVVAGVVMWPAGVWFPWLVIVGVQVPLALGFTVLRQTRELQRDKLMLEQTLAMVQAREEPDGLTTSDVRGGFARPRVAEGREGRSPVGMGSSARPSGPSAAVQDLLEAARSRPGTAPSVPDHQLIRRIGRGAYGEVWIGKDVIGSYHAIKMVFRDAFKEAEPYDREFKGLSRFTPISRNHPGLVHVLQVGRNDAQGYLYYVMELADDAARTGSPIQPESYVPRTLAEDLKTRRRLPVVECLDVAIQLADALAFLHGHHLIHRDIKPSNVIFVRDVPKFADIGLVTDVAATDHDVSYLGTKGYIAPEGPGTPAADVYSLGKVIYQMAFGLDVSRFPELPTDVVVDPEESALFGLNHVVMRACDSSVAGRYKTAEALGAALRLLRRPTSTPPSQRS